MEEKKGRGGKIIRTSIMVVLALTVVFFAGRYFLFFKIRQAIERELASLREQEIFVEYDNLDIYPWTGRLEVTNLTVKVRKDSLENLGLDARIPEVLIRGIDLIPFLKNRTLSIHLVEASDAEITYAEGATLFQYDSTQRRKIELQNIAVRRVDLPRIDLYVRDKDAVDTLAHLLTSIDMDNIYLHKQLDSMTWQRGQVLISDLAINAYREDYGFSAKKIRFGIREKTIDIDSFRVKPVLSKAAFMKNRGKEDTYIDGFVRSMKIRGVNWFVYPRPAIMANSITTTFYLDLYRDKRYPFREKPDKKLPSHMLHGLPFELVIDTVRIQKSFVRYEEHPEEGDSSGHVFFDDLYATIDKIHNNPQLKRDIRMDAKTRFMGTGQLTASFSFPYDTIHAYTASGTLTNMPLSDVNVMLKPAAKARIQHGQMKKLSFEFSYTPVKSDGKLLLNYENLKIQTLRTNGKNEEKVSKLKTLLLNTFIIKKDMDEDVEKDERTGHISFERDPRRSVFNYWWKSLLSGLKEAYNLDNLPIPSKGKPEKDTARKKKKKGLKDIFSKIF